LDDVEEKPEGELVHEYDDPVTGDAPIAMLLPLQIAALEVTEATGN